MYVTRKLHKLAMHDACNVCNLFRSSLQVCVFNSTRPMQAMQNSSACRLLQLFSTLLHTQFQTRITNIVTKTWCRPTWQYTIKTAVHSMHISWRCLHLKACTSSCTKSADNCSGRSNLHAATCHDRGCRSIIAHVCATATQHQKQVMQSPTMLPGKHDDVAPSVCCMQSMLHNKSIHIRFNIGLSRDRCVPLCTDAFKHKSIMHVAK